MKIFAKILIVVLFGSLSLTGCTQNAKQVMKFKELTLSEKNVIINKGTEAPWSGIYVDNKEDGIYTCKQCGAELYRSGDKFDSHCGWPSFDDEIKGAVKRIPDADGMRTEIVCANCGGHLGHVFKGEGFTPKNTRHCVNSISLDFVADKPDKTVKEPKTDTAIFAGGCFWGVEYYMQKNPGVISTTVGYTGGHIKNPTYEEVCSHTSGHIEAIQVIFRSGKNIL